MQIDRMDHLVLTVADLATTASFYERVLGLTHQVVDGRHSVGLGSQVIHLHQAGQEVEPKAERPTPGAYDLCFVASGALTDVAKHVVSCGVAIEDGPVARVGARGAMRSIYLRDPDRNLIEIAVYDATPTAVNPA
jgi:catechol 2,3-dioxygenase-like lactoylglutathione lyase family enzyme